MNDPKTSAYVEPVVKTVRVAATQTRAFDVFTASMGRWWLPTHSINATKALIADVVIEPRSGGRWYERGVDGSECDWGHVIVWEPPKRLVLAWQIDADWKFNPKLLTEVEVRFDAQSQGATQVTLEHRFLDRYGEAGASVRESIDSPEGWTALLDRFAKALFD